MFFRIFDCEKNRGEEIELDNLIARITAFNIRENFEFETIKAITVMVRTELARRMNIYGGHGCEAHKGYDICTEAGHCLEHKIGDGMIPARAYEAVAATKDKVITFEGKPIKPYSHYRCGGSTENSESVIGNRVTYLRRVLCTHCKDMADEDCEKCFTLEELEKRLNTKLEKPENIYSGIRGMFEDIEVDDQGRVRSIIIGTRKFRGIDLVKLLDLNSTRFNYTPVKFLVKTVGIGHGLGLCQCGADEMARQGRSYEEILKYYYTGVQIEEMQMEEEGKPLKGKKLVIDAGYGGEDSNDARGAGGLREKDVNLDIVLMLKEMLEKDGAVVYLTRDSDTSMALSERADKSNTIKPDFFLSILQNSFASTGVSGTEIYHFRGDTAGERLARFIIEEVCTSLGVKNRGIRTADFFLLREVKASSVILQLLYISNPEDEARLKDKNFRKEAAAAIYRAIEKYYENRNNK